MKRGDDTASVPDDLAPDELTLDVALELLAAPKSDEPIGELDGYPVFAKNGRYGPYVQWGTADNLPPGMEKPKMASLFKTMTLERITVDDAEELLQLPRTLGVDPADGEAIVANNGRYGPYVQKGKDFRIDRHRGTAPHDHARPGAGDLLRSRRCSAAAAAEHGREGAAARVRQRPGERQGRSSPRTAASACTSPTARPTRRSAGATASRR